MEFRPKNPPRRFPVGVDGKIELSDMGELSLAPNEMVTFVAQEGARYDFVAKDWGFYATPSINARLKMEGFKTALVQNDLDRIFLMVVEKSRMAAFEEYCRVEQQKILQWLDEIPEKS